MRGVYARPLPMSISTVMRNLPFSSNRERRDRTSSRTTRRSAAASRKYDWGDGTDAGFDRLPIVREAYGSNPAAGISIEDMHQKVDAASMAVTVVEQPF